MGLSITVSAGAEPVTLTVMDSHTAATSILLPLTAAGDQDGQIVLYAQNPGAFIDLAADARIALGAGNDVIIDGHLPPPTPLSAQRGVNALADRSTIDQALGFLIEQGHPPVQARTELARRATVAGASIVSVALRVIQSDRRPDPDAEERAE